MHVDEVLLVLEHRPPGAVFIGLARGLLLLVLLLLLSGRQAFVFGLLEILLGPVVAALTDAVGHHLDSFFQRRGHFLFLFLFLLHAPRSARVLFNLNR